MGKKSRIFQAGTLIKLSSSAVKGKGKWGGGGEKLSSPLIFFFAPSFGVSVVKYAEELRREQKKFTPVLVGKALLG